LIKIKLTPKVDTFLTLEEIISKSSAEIEYVYSLLKKRGKNLFTLIKEADEIRFKLVGDRVSFVVNYNINFTNYCVGSCKFCSFKSSNNSLIKGYRMDTDKFKESVEDAIKKGVSEICIQGGLDPNLTYEDYLELIKIIRSVSSTVHIHAFSPSEIAYISHISEENVEDIFRELKSKGLNSFPGTAAEILNDEVRKVICPEKITTQEWIDIVITGHKLGIHSSSTIMYGHIESLLDEAKHLVILKKIQEETGMFTEFVPLPFVHHHTLLYNKYGAQAGSTGLHDLAIFSSARVYFDNCIPNIQVSWPKLGLKFAQFSLYAGVNDLGGTLYHENISKSAGAKYGEFTSVDDFVRIIKDAGRIPVQRNTIYKEIISYC